MSLISGAGGGGKAGGGGGGISEDPDNLSSVALARFVDLIGEGEIGGLVNNEYSIYLDGVPLRNLSGTANYRPFRWAFRHGTQAQDVIPGFAGTQQENGVGIEVLKSYGFLIRSIPDADADAVRVTLAVQGLTTTSTDGRVTGGQVDYRIHVRVAAGTWQLAYDGSIRGKTTARYQRSHEVPLAGLGPGPYEVALERISDDTTSGLIVDNLFWDSYTVINYERFTYPNSALCAIEIDARYFSQIPSRSYHVRGLLIRVPTNYDPITRVYATSGPGTTNGGWDGTFKIAWSNNPAWCYYDILLSRRYGLGKRISASQVDKWAIYRIGQYCDDTVPTGIDTNRFSEDPMAYINPRGSLSGVTPMMQGAGEPRFTLNGVINTRDEAPKVLNQIAAVFRGMAYWSNNSVTLTQDRPDAPTMIYTNANVKDGRFQYEGSSRAQRNTVCIVGWNDPAEDFKQKWEYVEDRTAIARYGLRSTEVMAFGTTSRSQARRLGLWYLYTQRIEKEAITFQVGQDSAFVEPGEIVKILDNNRAGVRWGGRVIAATTTSLTLDGPVHLTPGEYTLSTMSADGLVVTRAVNVVAEGDFTNLTVTLPYTNAPSAMSIWMLQSPALDPQLARVVSVNQEGPFFMITCLQHVPTKNDEIERGAAANVPNYSVLTLEEVVAPAGLTLRENSFKPTVIAPIQVNLDISWNAASSPMIRGYVVRVVGANNISRTLPESNDPSVTVEGLVPQTYTVTVSAVNVFGIVGVPASAVINILGRDLTPPAAVTGFGFVIDPVLGVRLVWSDVPDFIDYYEIRRGTTWETATFVDQVKATSRLLGPLSTTSQTYLIKAVDTSGNPSSAAASTLVTAVAPSAPSLSYALAGDHEVVSWSIPSASFAIDEYELRYGSTWAGATFVLRTRATSYRRKVDYGGARRYWIAAIDVAGNVGNPSPLDVEIAVPGPVVSQRSEVIDNNALLFWQPPVTGSLPIERYEVRKGATYAGGTLVGSNGNSTFAAVFETASGLYNYWVVAFDSAGNQGSPVAITATVSQPPDYVLRTTINSTFSGTKTNLLLEAGALIGPVNTTETWASHFSSRGWNTIQDQINAGYPLYIQPGLSSASYEESFDYGAVLPATTITATVGTTAISGSVTLSCQISYKLNSGDAWTNAPVGATSVLASNFRYVRVTFSLSCTAGVNLLRLDYFELKLANKLRTDSGVGTITNASSGVFVPFNVPFVDADTPIVQPNGTTPLVAVVDFTDTSNPTGFTVYLYNQSGVQVTGSFSWTARGY